MLISREIREERDRRHALTTEFRKPCEQCGSEFKGRRDRHKIQCTRFLFDPESKMFLCRRCLVEFATMEGAEDHRGKCICEWCHVPLSKKPVEHCECAYDDNLNNAPPRPGCARCRGTGKKECISDSHYISYFGKTREPICIWGRSLGEILKAGGHLDVGENDHMQQ